MNDGGPAFPLQNNFNGPDALTGITVRDYFAAKAMLGILNTFSNQASIHGFFADAEAMKMNGKDLVSHQAYEQADSMLAEREKK